MNAQQYLMLYNTGKNVIYKTINNMEQEFKSINIENLQLDLYNPRLPKSKQDKDEKTVIEYLLLEAATSELMESIGENNFFVGEMLLVIRDSYNDRYVVIEGNRRLAAVKLLNNPSIATVKKLVTKEISERAKYKPTELPCLIFNHREEIQQFLGFVHITGKKSWRMLEKARYLYDLRNNENHKNLSLDEASREIARTIGSRSPYVRKMLISYALYEIVEDEKFYQIDGLSDSTFFLNYFSDGLMKDNIRKYLNIDWNSNNPLEFLDNEHLKELVGWWFQKTEGVSRVIGDSEGMKMLNEVLGNSIALEAFKKGAAIHIAYELTDDLDLQFERKIKNSLRAIEEADRLSNKIKTFYQGLYEDLKSICQIANKIKNFKNQIEQDNDGF